MDAGVPEIDGIQAAAEPSVEFEASVADDNSSAAADSVDAAESQVTGADADAELEAIRAGPERRPPITEIDLNGRPDRGIGLKHLWAGDVEINLSPSPAEVEVALQQLALVSIEATQGFPRAEEEIKTFAAKEDEDDDGEEAEAET